MNVLDANIYACPLLKAPCLGDKCMFWRHGTKLGHPDPDGDCVIVAAASDLADMIEAGKGLAKS